MLGSLLILNHFDVVFSDLLAISVKAHSHFNLSRPLKKLKLHHHWVVLLAVSRYQLDTDILVREREKLPLLGS